MIGTMNNAGSKFRAWLADHGIKHTWAARHLQVTPVTLSRWLSGGHTPSPYTRARIAKLTGGVVPAADWGKGEPK